MVQFNSYRLTALKGTKTLFLYPLQTQREDRGRGFRFPSVCEKKQTDCAAQLRFDHDAQLAAIPLDGRLFVLGDLVGTRPGICGYGSKVMLVSSAREAKFLPITVLGANMSQFSKSRILYNLQRTRVLSLQMIDRVPQEQWFEMPLGITHVAWHVGHMAIAEYFLGLLLVRGAQDEDQSIIPENYRELFGYGSQVSGDQARYPSPAALLSVLAAVHDRVIKETQDLPDAVLDEPVVFDDPEFDHHPIFDLKGGALEWSTYHEHIHIGSIGLLRRQLGADPIEYLQESRDGKKFV